jgi:hypothetical protein
MRRGILGIFALLFFVSGARGESTDALLDSLQHTSFLYFWNEANPSNGLIKDRSASGSPCSIAAVGFGLTAICIGVDHGWVTRTAGRDRVLTALRTFWNGPQGSGSSGYIGYKGFFYHFLDMNTALRTWDSELSTIDTALLLAGILDAKQYFTLSDPSETEIRSLADSIYRRVDWPFMQNYNPGILLGWKPGTGFLGYGQWIGYNEAMILYILALGSPTHPVAATAWNTWTSGYQWQTWYGYSYVVFPPLFGHQYSHCWIDFRDIADTYMHTKGITYFENSRRATLAQRAYCAANPGRFIGYSDTLWGLTACDGPNGYKARGAPPAQNDDGTIAPTASISSIPFAPEVVIPTVQNMYNSFKPYLWSIYGFRDAFNLNVGWWDTDVLGIDQGPIIIMIENYKTGSVWSRFMQNADIARGLAQAGFKSATDILGGTGQVRNLTLLQNEPNPFRTSTNIRYTLARASRVRLRVYDATGRPVATLVDGVQASGPHTAVFHTAGLPNGTYEYTLQVGEATLVRKCVVIR